MIDILYGCLGLLALIIIIPLVAFPVHAYMMKDVPTDPIGRLEWQAKHGNQWAATTLSLLEENAKLRAEAKRTEND